MEYIILDTNVITRYPKILAIRNPELKLIIPIEVLMELSNNSKGLGKIFTDRLDLIEMARKENLVEIWHSNPSPTVEAITFTSSGSPVENFIVRIADSLKEDHQIVRVATLDKEVISVMQKNQIEVLSPENIEHLLSSFQIPASKIKGRLVAAVKHILLDIYGSYSNYLPKAWTQKLIAEFENLEAQVLLFEEKELGRILRQALFSILVLILGFIAYNNFQHIVNTIQVWGTIVAIIVIGLALFVFREKLRLSYGIVELAVGVISILTLFQSSHFNYAEIDFNMDFNIKLLGGLYIMVRGQDNILKALKGTKVGTYLNTKWGLGS